MANRERLYGHGQARSSEVFFEAEDEDPSVMTVPNSFRKPRKEPKNVGKIKVTTTKPRTLAEYLASPRPKKLVTV